MDNMQLIKKIYEKMGDDISRNIFMKRLEYSITGDISYIDKMVDSEMARYEKNDGMNLLLEWIDERTDEVVLFGAGVAGVHIMQILKRKGIKISCIADNDKTLWSKSKNGVQVVSPSEIDKSAHIIIGVNKYAKEIYKQLCDRGYSKDNIYVSDKHWWLGNEKQYFDSHIVIPGKKEVFVDGGALDGEDTLNFFKWCASAESKAYLFEPSLSNFDKLEKYMQDDKRAECIAKGIWCEKAELRFDTGTACTGQVSDKGDIVVKVTSIDEELNGREVTYIKMDIEGSELQALIGATETIKKYKPRLAICVYHKKEDILDIPEKILQLNPEYKLYLRHYSYIDTETVLYAI